MTLTIATWNINSLRLRQSLLDQLIGSLQPDIICLQETKVPDELFPEQLAERIAFPHVLKRGMKGYNGVAILSRIPISAIPDTPDWVKKNDCRHIAARVETGAKPITLHNFYVPAGGDIPDRRTNEKFAHKLDFIAEARAHFALYPPARALLVGDLNIAPLENDVWSHKQLLDIVSHTPVETAGLTAWQAEGFYDALRPLRSTRGKTLHLVVLPQPRLARFQPRPEARPHLGQQRPKEKPTLHKILIDARDWPQPSDHVPVAVTLKL